jgi:hypothetical protein
MSALIWPAIAMWAISDGPGTAGAALASRALVALVPEMSTSIQVVYISALPLGRPGSTPGSVSQSHTQ